ncbi:hypothetical protein ACS126_13145 [Sphingobacterium lactis]|uniref:hypothetical protein n=1 Tax=Sphingobacterium lactis TaxID=797291 RepID=UPI003EC812CF
MDTDISKVPVSKTVGPFDSSELPAEDGAMRIGSTRISHAFILERDPFPPDDGNILQFAYDVAGNQIRRDLIGQEQ